MRTISERTILIERQFSLAQTCGPAAWVGARSPRQAWINGAFLHVEWEGEHIVWRRVSQPAADALTIVGTASPDEDVAWMRRVLGSEVVMPVFTEPAIALLADRYPGMRPLNDGSLFNGLLSSIVGQSISVAAAAVTQAKLAAAFTAPIELEGRAFWPLPRADQLAEASVALIRTSGVTWKRAEAVQAVARAELAGELPSDDDALREPDVVAKALVALPGVGRWTAESALLWGVGAVDAHPSGDVALLRATRLAYDDPALTLRDLDALAERWSPARALAARLLWTDLFGIAS